MEKDVTICYCNNVNKSEIVKAIKEKGLKPLTKLAKKQWQEPAVDSAKMIFKNP